MTDVATGRLESTPTAVEQPLEPDASTPAESHYRAVGAEPVYTDDVVTLHNGDCLDVLRSLPDHSVDAVVTDPPYGLGFMGKTWDSDFIPSDMPMRGNPALDAVNTGASRQGGRQRASEAYQRRQARDARAYQEWCEQWARECLRVLKPGGHMLAFGGTRTAHRLASAIEDAGFELRDTIAWLYGSGFPKSLDVSKAITGTHVTTGASRAAGEPWQGWGTALKPANEPIVVARKSPMGTVAANVLTHGTGALNIDACRIDTGGEQVWTHRSGNGSVVGLGTEDVMPRYEPGDAEKGDRGGRWPTNVVLDPEMAAQLDAQTGKRPSSGVYDGDGSRRPGDRATDFGGANRPASMYDDEGGASRFFPTFRYEAKAPTDERPRVGAVAHPTVKPLDLMRWLVRLVTPPGGTVLEPFAGSGTTAEACIVEGFRCIAIEREPDYISLILARITKPIEPVLFGESA